MAHVAAPNAGPGRWTWLLISFTRREILSRYAGSVTGLAWSLLHPLAQLAIFAYVFSQVFRVAVPPGYPGATYVGYVAVALWPWIMFSEGMTRAMGSIGANAGLIRKVAFPHRLLVYASVLACCAVHAAGFIVVLLALKAFGEPIRLAGLPVALLLLVPYMLLAAGIGAVLAALQTLLRDVEHVVQVVITILFYASPILYPASLIPAALQGWVKVNPLAWFSERMREVLLQGGGFVPGDAIVAAGCVAVFFAGLWVFNRLSPSFEDFL
ncbi:MAG: ABC transporter permease [Pseudomonadota bacterium]|nr:ABC transporter permease [Pseudomonadota bacterium]